MACNEYQNAFFHNCVENFLHKVNILSLFCIYATPAFHAYRISRKKYIVYHEDML